MSSADQAGQAAPQPPPQPSVPHPSHGRSALVWLLIVLAAVLGFVSALTTWVNRQALDTQSWTRASAQLIDDPQVRSALSVYIVNQVYDNVDVSGEIAKNLPSKYGALGSPIAAALRSPAQQGVDRLLGQPRVVSLWENANRVAHEQLVAILENKTRPGVSTANGTVTVDLRTVVIELAKQFGLSGNLLSNIPSDAGQITVLRSNQLAVAQDSVKAVRVLSVWLVVLVLLLWALALYLARGARRTTLRDIGWSIVAVGLLLLVVRRVGENYVLGALTTPSTRPVGHRVWLIATQLIGQIGWALIAYGVVTVLGAALAGPTRVATRLRGWLAPILNTRQAVAWAVAGAAYLLLVLWGPTHSLRTPLGILLFGALGALGVYTLRRQTLQEFPDAVHGSGPGLAARAEALTERAEDLWGRRPRHHHQERDETVSNTGSGSTAEELERLHALHTAGALSDEEFQRAKERALA
jgi:hypothetical protein